LDPVAVTLHNRGDFAGIVKVMDLKLDYFVFPVGCNEPLKSRGHSLVGVSVRVLLLLN
jgi:hypothetical protein